MFKQWFKDIEGCQYLEHEMTELLGKVNGVLFPGGHARAEPGTKAFLINWSISELNTQVNPTTYLGDTDCWIQQVTAPTLVVTGWIQQSVCILHSSPTWGCFAPLYK